MDKPERSLEREPVNTHAPPDRVQPACQLVMPVSGTEPAPRFSRLTKSMVVVAPDDCMATVLFKEVARDDNRYFSFWLLVGRYQRDELSVHYKFTGEDTIRCDIPHGNDISTEALQPALVEFLRAEGTLPDGPPVITGKGHDP